MPDLVVVIPSRRRPDAVAELALACAKTCTADTALLVVVDTDDPTLSMYADLLRQGLQLEIATTATTGHVPAINYGAQFALSAHAPFALAKLDDDHRPRTVGWDTHLLAALRDMGTGIAYGNDLLQGERLPTAPALTADIVRELGYMGPPGLRHLFVDDFWRDLGRGADCLRYLPGVIVEHLHPAAGKSEWTEGHQRANSPEAYRRDAEAYERYAIGQLPIDVAKVRALREGARP